MSVFFYDSYAIIEYLNNNPRFVPYFENHTGILTAFNLVEVYYSALLSAGKEKADVTFDILYPLVVEPSKVVLKQAMVFRMQQKKQKLSYADCVGYYIAQERKIKFLTGDKQFEGLKNVEFLK
jgi:uncharacterized protein